MKKRDTRIYYGVLSFHNVTIFSPGSCIKTYGRSFRFHFVFFFRLKETFKGKLNLLLQTASFPVQ